jgi:cyclic-di-GMP phosphodiesterase, flagellum assembly factor TipF
MTGKTTRGRFGPGGAGYAVTIATLLVAAGGGIAAAAIVSPASGLLILNAVALTGLGLVAVQARAARLAADKASADLDAVAIRLIKLEHRFALHAREPGGAPDPALRSTVAEVSGEIGLLGGILRDLAETVAAQDRDMADLRERLAPRSRPEPKAVLVARPEAVRAPPVPPVPIEPEPSLLPQKRREPAVSDAEARRMAAIVQAFEADRIELHLQPVVALPQRRVRLYEALARLRLADETILVPAEFMPLLERLGHAAELDRRVIGRAVAIARHLAGRGSEAVVSVNLSPISVGEPGFLRSVARLLDAAPDTAGRLALELSQRCWRNLDAERAGSLAALRDRGVPLALDRAGDLRVDPLALADRGVRFVKLPADLLLAPAAAGVDLAVADLAPVLARAGIRLIAERVEAEEMVPDLIDLDVPLAQGFVFAAPRAVRPEVLAAPAAEAPPAPAAPEPPPEPDPPPAPPREERRSFRDFLRRAG